MTILPGTGRGTMRSMVEGAFHKHVSCVARPRRQGFALPPPWVWEDRDLTRKPR